MNAHTDDESPCASLTAVLAPRRPSPPLRRAFGVGVSAPACARVAPQAAGDAAGDNTDEILPSTGDPEADARAAAEAAEKRAEAKRRAEEKAARELAEKTAAATRIQNVRGTVGEQRGGCGRWRPRVRVRLRA